MNNIYELLHAHMFDGAEGAGGGDASSSNNGDSAEGTEPTVVYGKAEEPEAESQVGADENEGEGEVDTPDLEGEFDELVKGKYKQQYDARVQNAINRRFKNSQDYQSTIGEYEDATQILYAKYGLKAGDIKGLKNALENDNGLYAEAAEQEGLTTEKYRENLRLKAEAERGRSMMEEFKAQQERQQTFERWDAEAGELREAFPNFDLNAEFENETFMNNLNRIGSVKDAFYVTHLQDILSGAMQHSERAATKAAVDNFKANASRPIENGVKHSPAIVRKDDPSKWTEKELFEVAERARRGEKIML